MDCEDRRHLTVVGLHDTGPRSATLETDALRLGQQGSRDQDTVRQIVRLCLLVAKRQKTDWFCRQGASPALQTSRQTNGLAGRQKRADLPTDRQTDRNRQTRFEHTGGKTSRDREKFRQAETDRQRGLQL